MLFKLLSKLFGLTFCCLMFSLKLFSQDGSNIRYIKVTDLNETHLNKPIQLDFYNRSFAGLHIDTVSIALKGKTIKFVEHRQDNGFNNWFYKQYIQSVDSISGYRLRLIKCEIYQLTRDEILTKDYFNFYDSEDQALLKVPIIDTNSFRRKSIAEVLVLAE